MRTLLLAVNFALAACASSSSRPQPSSSTAAATASAPPASPSAPPASPSAAPAGSYDACAGKRCGDTCTLCAPGAKDCVETMSIKACDAAGKCSDSAPKCD